MVKMGMGMEASGITSSTRADVSTDMEPAGTTEVKKKKMSSRQAALRSLQSHNQSAKKRRARATDTYIVFEPYHADVPSERITRFTAGMKIEAVDLTQAWYRAEVLNVDHRAREVLVHWVGYDHRFNQIMSFDSPLIRPAGRLERQARTLRNLDRSRIKTTKSSQSSRARREASPPWRLPGMMDVEPGQRRDRKPVQLFTVPPRELDVAAKKRAEARKDAEQAAIKAKLATAAESPSGGSPETEAAHSQVKAVASKRAGAARGTQGSSVPKNKQVNRARAGKKQHSASLTGSIRPALDSPARRAGQPAPPAPPRSTTKDRPRSMHPPPPVLVVSDSCEDSPSPSPPPTPGGGKEQEHRRHRPITIKLRLSKPSGVAVGAAPPKRSGSGGGPSPITPKPAGRVSDDDDAFVFEFPLAPKLEVLEVKEIVTPEFRTLSSKNNSSNPARTASGEGGTDRTVPPTPPVCADWTPPSEADEDAMEIEGGGHVGLTPLTTPSSADFAVESLDDETFAARHLHREMEERKRYELLLDESGGVAANPLSPYAVIKLPQRLSANQDATRWASVPSFEPRVFDGVFNVVTTTSNQVPSEESNHKNETELLESDQPEQVMTPTAVNDDDDDDDDDDILTTSIEPDAETSSDFVNSATPFSAA